MNTSKIIKGVVSNGRYTVTAPIAKEEHVHKNHIKEILKDMCVTFTDEMDKADTEAEAAFKDSFR